MLNMSESDRWMLFTSWHFNTWMFWISRPLLFIWKWIINNIWTLFQLNLFFAMGCQYCHTNQHFFSLSCVHVKLLKSTNRSPSPYKFVRGSSLWFFIYNSCKHKNWGEKKQGDYCFIFFSLWSSLSLWFPLSLSISIQKLMSSKCKHDVLHFHATDFSS